MTILHATILMNMLFIASARAAEISENFSTKNFFASGTAVWNQALGKVHPTLRVMNFNGAATKPFEVGNGSHGSFDISTYANFSVGGDISGNKIRFDTSTFPVLKVTSFHLANGWVLEPVGSNPLIVYSLSDIRIEGQIWCQGRNGGAPLGATPGSGGIGRCGGANGGAGGALSTAGNDGLTPDAAIGGGQRGDGTIGVTAGVSGGGGGSWNLDYQATASANVTGTGGNAGASFSESEFNGDFGGAGGGGGGGSASEPGAGGGAGGGTVILHAVGDINIGRSTNPNDGFILVYGGQGGSTSTDGGAGGGGGGGGVQAFSGAAINIYSNSGPDASDASRGTGGQVNSVTSGGLGAAGRHWLSSVTYNGVGSYFPIEEITTGLPGNVEFTSATESVTSTVFDLESSNPRVTALTASPTSIDFLVEAAGSNDGFAGDDTGWTTDLSLLQNKRYLRYRLSITASNVNTPDMLDALTISYSPANRENFNFQAAGCGRIDGGAPIHLAPFVFLFLFLLAARLGYGKVALYARSNNLR